MNEQTTRGPGRPRRQDPTQASDMANVGGGRRKKRLGDVGRDVLGFSGERDPDYIYRIVNDERGRVAQMLDSDWEIVQSGGQLGEEEVDKGSTLGSQTRRVVNRSNGTEAVLMRIRRDWYEEDQKAKQAKASDKMRGLLPNAKDGEYYSATGQAGVAIKIGN